MSGQAKTTLILVLGIASTVTAVCGVWYYRTWNSAGIWLVAVSRAESVGVFDPEVGKTNTAIGHIRKLYPHETKMQIAKSAVAMEQMLQRTQTRMTLEKILAVLGDPQFEASDTQGAVSNFMEYLDGKQLQQDQRRADAIARKPLVARARMTVDTGQPLGTWYPGSGYPSCSNLTGNPDDPFAFCSNCSQNLEWFGDRGIARSLKHPLDFHFVWDEGAQNFKIWLLDRTMQAVQYWSDAAIAANQQQLLLENRMRAMGSEWEASQESYHPLANSAITMTGDQAYQNYDPNDYRYPE